jgi:hypothetical protein
VQQTPRTASLSPPAQARAERIHDALERGHYTRAIELCELGLNGAHTTSDIDELRALLARARRGFVPPPPTQLPRPPELDEGIEAQGRGEFSRAVSLLRLVVARDPSNAEAHAHLGMSLLACSEFAEGWRGYEWRARLPWGGSRTVAAPRWDGSPIPGQTLMLWDEQGNGDAIQFIRFAIAAANASKAHVVFHGRPRLARLFASCPGVETSLPRSSAFPKPHAHASIMSLPAILGLDSATTPGAHPYLFAERALVEAWAARLAGLRKPRIGLVWQGNPGYFADGGRSVPLRYYVPLLRDLGAHVSFYSLQKGTGEDQLADLPPDVTLHELPGSADDGPDGFVDTAAVMMNLDLVISTDTSLAHLAGALGVPTWVVLGDGPDWRWGEERSETPFYPSMRLFRRTRGTAWSEVVAVVARALRGHLAQRAGL